MKDTNNQLKLLATFILGLSISACSENKTTDEYISEAQTLILNEKYNEAAIQLKNAVKLAPKDAASRMLLGKLSFLQGNYNSAIKELNKALELGGNAAESTFYLVQSYSKLHEFEDVYRLTNEAVSLSDSEYIPILTFAGITAVIEGDKAKAKNYFEQAVSIDETSEYGQLSLGYSAYVNDEHDKGLAISNALLASAPEISESLLLSGYIYLAKNDFKRASESYASYLNKHPLSGYVQQMEIYALINDGQIDLAEKKVDSVLAKFKEAPLAVQFKAQIAYLKNDYPTAMEYADKSINSGFDNEYVRTIAGVSAFKGERFETAYQHLKMVQGEMSDDNSIKKLFAFLQLKLGYQLESDSVFEDSELFNISDAELLGDTSLSLFNDGKTKLANKTIDKAVKLKPNDAHLLTLKARMNLDSDKDNAETLFKQALKLSPEMKAANIMLVKILMENGEFDEALSAVRKWRENNKDISESWLMEGVIYLSKKEYKASLKAFEQALEVDKDNVTAAHYKGISLIALQQYKEAEAVFKEVLEKDGSYHASLMKLVQLNKLGLISDLTDYIAQHHESNIDSPEVFFARLIQNYHAGNFHNAINIFEQHKDKYQLDDNIYLFIAKMSERVGSQEGAIKSYQYIIDRNPNNALANIGLVSAYIEYENFDKAERHIDNILKNYPDNGQFATLKARLQFSRGDVSAAKEFLNSPVALRDETLPGMKALKADLAYEEKDFSLAEKYYSELISDFPTKKNSMRLAISLGKNNKSQSGINVLKDFVSRNPQVEEAKILLAELQIKKDNGSAIAYYQNLLKRKSNNPGILNNLAWAQLQAGNVNEAVVSIEKAYSLASKHPKIIDTYANILVAKGDIKKALTLFAQANDLAPNDNEILIHYIEALISNGKLSEAKAKLSQLNMNTLTSQEKSTVEGLQSQL